MEEYMKQSAKSICFLLCILLCGCFAQKPSVNETVIAVQQPQIVEVAIVEGKTTKQEILDALGTPDKLSETSLTYNYMGKNTICQLSLTQKDGTKFNIELGADYYKYKSRYFIAFFHGKNPNIVSEVKY